MALIYCPECGTQVSDQAQACIKCAYPIAKLNFKQSANTGTNSSQSNQTNQTNTNFNDLDYYYQQEFEAIQKSNGEYLGKFNWYAFFFNWIWLLTKGAWGWALVILFANILSNIIASMLIGGVGSFIIIIIVGLIIAVNTGHYANLIYYRVKVENKQF